VNNPILVVGEIIMDLVSEFKKLLNGNVTDSSMLVPMLVWSSTTEKNIETSQSINNLFFYVDKNVLSRKLSYNNNCTNFTKYPSDKKIDDKLRFFYNDVCAYFGWSGRELNKNLELLDISVIKEKIAASYAYDNSQRKLLGLVTVDRTNTVQ
jgi:hypothetical protein